MRFSFKIKLKTLCKRPVKLCGVEGDGDSNSNSAFHLVKKTGKGVRPALFRSVTEFLYVPGKAFNFSKAIAPVVSMKEINFTQLSNFSYLKKDKKNTIVEMVNIFLTK